jgi:O-antigen ligase
VAVLLATGRWGSYLGLPASHIYLTDVGLVATAGWLLFRHSRLFEIARLRPLLPLAVLAGWSFVRFMTGRHFDATAARDLAPYAYVLAALAAAFTVTSYHRTLVAVEAALLLHLSWVWVTLLAPEWAGNLTLLGGTVRLLELRQDYDGAVLAVLAGLAALSASRAGSSKSVRLAWSGLLVFAAYTIMQLGSRAGVLALAINLCLVLLLRLRLLRQFGRARTLAVAALVLVALTIAVPRTYVFDRLTAVHTRSDSASGTNDARREAWRLVLEDAADKPDRLAIGSGFGPDFLERSGAAFWFEGAVEKGVRAPHNYILNGLARIGLVGVVILGWVVFALARAGFRVRSDPAGPDRVEFDELLLLLLCALGVASLVGVILESPFGAVPFWWAAGFLLVGSSSRNEPRPSLLAPTVTASP